MGKARNKVYYDDACYVCSFEVQVLRKHNPNCDIEFVRISELPDQAPYMQEMISRVFGFRALKDSRVWSW